MLRSGKILASRDNFGCVYECPCGTIHVAIGPIDLKLTPETFLEALSLLREAAERQSSSTGKTLPFHRPAQDGSQGRSH